MANTTKIEGVSLQIKLDGTDDWSIPGDLAGYVKSGINVKSIAFHPSAANDIMIIKAGRASQETEAAALATTATAPEIFHVKCLDDADQRVKYFGGERGERLWPFIDLTDCTLGTPANARIDIELA